MVDFIVLFLQCAHQFHSFFHMCAAILCCLLPLSFHLYPMPPFCTAQGTRAVIFTLSPLGGIEVRMTLELRNLVRPTDLAILFILTPSKK
jgi:hypothetical protein